MGIKSGFNKFLRDICPDVFEEIHISEYGFKRVAIDISLYLHKFKAVCGERWLCAFINLIACLRRNEIHCVFIFDGKAPPEKEAERAKRRDNREKMEQQLYELEESLDDYNKTGVVAKCLSDLYARRRSPRRLLGRRSEGVDMEWVENKIQQKRNQLYDIAPDDFDHAKELFRILKVPFYTAPWEAEKMCAKLCIDGKVDAVLSEDTDVMAYSAPVFLTKIDTSKDTCVRIQHEVLLEGLELDKKQLLDLCIMCGTDYNPNIVGIGSKTAYNHIKRYGSIEGFISNVKHRVHADPAKCQDFSVLNHIRNRQLFTEFEDYGLPSIPYCGSPNFEKLGEFVFKHQIQVNIEKLHSDFVHNVVVFEESEEEKQQEQQEQQEQQTTEPTEEPDDEVIIHSDDEVIIHSDDEVIIHSDDEVIIHSDDEPSLPPPLPPLPPTPLSLSSLYLLSI